MQEDCNCCRASPSRRRWRWRTPAARGRDGRRTPQARPRTGPPSPAELLPQSLPQVEGYEFAAHYESALRSAATTMATCPCRAAGWRWPWGTWRVRACRPPFADGKLSSDARFSLLTEPDSGKAITKLNDLLCEFNGNDRFVTLILAVLDPANHTVTMVSAGPPAPLRSAAGRRVTGRDATSSPACRWASPRATPTNPVSHAQPGR